MIYGLPWFYIIKFGCIFCGTVYGPWCPKKSAARIISLKGFWVNLYLYLCFYFHKTVHYSIVSECVLGAYMQFNLVFGQCVQYIPRNMHTVFALLCFVVVIHWLIFPYPSGLLHWHCGNLTIAPVPAKQPWWIWINTSCEFIMNDYITTTKQSTAKPCAYFLGYTVCGMHILRLMSPHMCLSYSIWDGMCVILKPESSSMT